VSGAGQDERRLLDLLGLAARARKLVTGPAGVRQGVREGKVMLVLVAADVAAAQLAKLVPLLDARGVPHHTLATREVLGNAVGRSPVAAVGLTDVYMARGIAQLVGARDAPRD
jgi:ribosomal protein L7Ae-like RNA K-turn-binding protein